jgi:tRNA(Ile)-lysidine synthase TilS/MesJ
LIGIRRSETREYCDDNALTYFDDPANEDDRFERVVVRRDVLSVIEERWGPGVVRAMGVSAERLWEDSIALTNLADRLYEGIAKTTDDSVSFDLAVIRESPRAFRRRLFERAVGRVRDRSGGIDAAVDALDSYDGSGTVTFSVAAGFEIALTPKEVVVQLAAPPPDASSN